MIYRVFFGYYKNINKCQLCDITQSQNTSRLLVFIFPAFKSERKCLCWPRKRGPGAVAVGPPQCPHSQISSKRSSLASSPLSQCPTPLPFLVKSGSVRWVTSDINNSLLQPHYWPCCQSILDHYHGFCFDWFRIKWNALGVQVYLSLLY